MSRNFERFDPSSTDAGLGPGGTLSRRTLLGGAFGLGTAFLLGACRNQSNQVSADPSPTGDGSASPTAAAAFPVQLDHKFGSTVVTATPERIACVGLTEHDAVLAVGMAPVAVTEWFGEFPSATWPWAQDKLGGAEPVVLSYADGIQIERVAEVAPDLILGTNAGLNKGTYKKLSSIAPTLAQSGDYTDYFEPWKVQTTAIGKALGKDEEMQTLIQGVDDTFAAARAEHPEFEGKNVFLMAPDFFDGQIFVYQEGLSTQFLLDLGLKIPDVVKDYATDPSTAYIPKEDLVDVLEVGDVVIWATYDDGAALRKDPIVKRLRSTRENRNLFTGLELTGAMNFTTVLSLPFVAEKLVPQLAEILGG
jgi:iron complex transport system substrate-binding protein